MKIGILYICTGKYEKFFDKFFESSEQFFLPNHTKNYYVFTESARLKEKYSHNSHIFFVEQKHITWPLDTLLRFWMFLQIREELLQNDFLVFLNANVLFLETISDEEFLPNNKNETLLACKHIYFDKIFRKNWSFSVPRYFFPYERNKKSQVYIPYGKGFSYFYGGMNGGYTKDFLEIIEKCWLATKIDLSKNIIARWHDESYVNYFFNQDEYFSKLKILHPKYLFPEGRNFPFAPKILLREKHSHSDLGFREI